MGGNETKFVFSKYLSRKIILVALLNEIKKQKDTVKNNLYGKNVQDFSSQMLAR